MQREVLQRANKKSKLDTKTGGRNKKMARKISQKDAKEGIHRNNQNLILWKDKMIDSLKTPKEKEKEK